MTLNLGVPPHQARVTCVFLHGRGQSPEEMEQGVIRHLSTPGVAYILPRAPGGVWYAARALDALTDDTRHALAQSLATLGKVMTGLQGPVLLAGFSQGACLALEYAFANGPWQGALAALTGCRVGQVTDTRPHANLAGLPTYLSGGDNDPWISVTALSEAVAALGTAQARLRADIFPGRAHEVGSTEIAILDAMLADLAALRPVTLERGA